MSYFKPWRRKFGVLTLLLACAFMGLWIRSFRRGDFVTTEPVQRVSFRGRLFIQRLVDAKMSRFLFAYDSEDDRHTSDVYEDPHFAELWSWRWCGFAAGTTAIKMAPDGTLSKWNSVQYLIPYWSIVIPLTSLSAWLVLSKPRPAKQTEPPITTTN